MFVLRYLRERTLRKKMVVLHHYFPEKKKKSLLSWDFWISAVSSERVSSFGRQTPLNISANFNKVRKKEKNWESGDNDGHHDAEDDDDDDEDNNNDDDDDDDDDNLPSS